MFLLEYLLSCSPCLLIYCRWTSLISIWKRFRINAIIKIRHSSSTRMSPRTSYARDQHGIDHGRRRIAHSIIHGDLIVPLHNTPAAPPQLLSVLLSVTVTVASTNYEGSDRPLRLRWVAGKQASNAPPFE